jgi:3-deoxy-manno-octulosonate cytidylyltransferase (CMP-KDO synthetase)
MKQVVIIPARLDSSRFPRKILLDIYGVPMVEHVRRRVLLSKNISDVYIATCDQEIADALTPFGAKVIMTSKEHENGTARVAEAISKIDCDEVILVQGDEPLILPRHIDLISNEIANSQNISVWNATGPLESINDLERNSFVKCSVIENNILYCFRKSPSFKDFESQKIYIRKVLGIIAFKKDFLNQLVKLKPSLIEKIESIEQMRIIENGYSIKSIPLESSQPSINEPDELTEVLNYIKSNTEQQMLLEKVLNFKQ